MMVDPAGNESFSFGRAAKVWFQDSIRNRGIGRTGIEFVVRVWSFLRDLTPSRRRLRFGDLEFDFDHNVNTTWSNVSLRTRAREIFSGEPYQPIEPNQFHEMIAAVPLIPSEFTFLDMGSGKGRALLLASEYPFRRVIGVEINPELHAIAMENVRRYRSEGQKCARLECWCGDGRNFEFPNEDTLLYLFNPFFEPVLKAVLENLRASLISHPRRVILLYANPLSENVVTEARFLRKIGGTHQYAIFESVSPQL